MFHDKCNFKSSLKLSKITNNYIINSIHFLQLLHKFYKFNGNIISIKTVKIIPLVFVCSCVFAEQPATRKR